MKIGTWNINGVIRYQGALLRWLAEQEPDIVALQKIKVSKDEFPTDTFDSAGYFAEADCARNDYGVAILIRKNRKEIRVLPKGRRTQEQLGTGLLTVEVDGLEFSSVYAPYGENKDIRPKLEWFRCLTTHMTTHIQTPNSQAKQRVLCDDFNVVPEYRVGPTGPVPNSPNYHKDVQEKFRALLQVGGLFDLYIRRPPSWENPFLFEGRQGCLKFSRLEYILGSQSILDRCLLVRIDFEYAIFKNDPFYWVRAPIVAHLRD